VAGWLRARPLLADGLLACLLAAFSLVALWYGGRDCDHGCRPGDAAAVALVLAQTGPLAWRRRRPLAAALVTGLASAAYGLAPYPDLAMPMPVGAIVGLYSVAAWGSRQAALVAGGVAATVVVVVMTLPRTDADLVDAAFGSLALAGAWILGDRARLQRAFTAELQERAVRLEREQAGEARRSVAEERTRIARELHDVVAHHISSIGVQAGGARRVMSTDPEAAKNALSVIEDSSRTAVNEMRQLLGMLRAADPDLDVEAPAGKAPQAGADRLPALIADVNGEGLSVGFHQIGHPVQLPETVSVSVYRIAQEALTNVRRHSTARSAHITLRYLGESVELEVIDDGRPKHAPVGSRLGHVGIRERVGLLGGETEIGPRPVGGFRVRVRIPLDPQNRPLTGDVK
jgi:signal transduction histidine kinase